MPKTNGDRAHAKSLIDKYLAEIDPQPEEVEIKPRVEDPILDRYYESLGLPELTKQVMEKLSLGPAMKPLVELGVAGYNHSVKEYGYVVMPSYVDVLRSEGKESWHFEIGYKSNISGPGAKFKVSMMSASVASAFGIMPKSSAAARAYGSQMEAAFKNAIPWLSGLIREIYGVIARTS